MTDTLQQSETTFLFTATSAPQPIISAAEFTQSNGSHRTDPASFINGAKCPLPLSEHRGTDQTDAYRFVM